MYISVDLLIQFSEFVINLLTFVLLVIKFSNNNKKK